MKALIWPITLIGLVVASSAQAFEYVDNRGIRHWNHDSGSNPVIRKEVVQNPNKPRVEIVEDTVKFYPIDEDPSDSIAQQRNEQSSAAPTPLDQTAGRSIAKRSRAVRHKPRRVKREQNSCCRDASGFIGRGRRSSTTGAVSESAISIERVFWRWTWTGRTCALSLWNSAGSVRRSCCLVVTRRCATAFN